MGSTPKRPSTVTASGSLVVQIEDDELLQELLAGEFTLTLSQGVSRLTVGDTPAIESRSREVTLMWFRVRQRFEENARRKARASEPVTSRFKRPPGVAIQILEDGRITCPQCAVVSPWGVCELCDDAQAITLIRLEQWNLERPDEAWELDELIAGVTADEATRGESDADDVEAPSWPA